MNIQKDKNNILTIFNENIPQTKEYTYHVSGYTFSDFDKGIIVLHKKEWKIISLKNLGDNMSIVYIAPREEMKIPFDQEGFMNGLCLFEGFNETTGEKNYFIPKFTEKEIEPMNKKLQALEIKAEIQKTDKGFFVVGANPKEYKGKYLSFLFALVLLYGKMDAKNGELIGIKIHIPLFGQFLKHEEIFDMMKKQLAEEGIFIKTDTLTNNNGITYQISSNDYELLEIWAKWYEAVEKFEKISKREFTEEMKTKLIEFIETNPEIPQDGKAEVLKELKEGTIKLLTK